jgi:hypothetical protein
MAGRKKKSRKAAKMPIANKNAPRRRKFTLKRAAKRVAKMLLKHLVETPEKEREERIAYVERQLAKRFGKKKRKKRA